jgi:hypothetical protein
MGYKKGRMEERNYFKSKGEGVRKGGTSSEGTNKERYGKE